MTDLVCHSFGSNGFDDAFRQPRLVVAVVFQLDVQSDPAAGQLEQPRRMLVRGRRRSRGIPRGSGESSDFVVSQLPDFFGDSRLTREIAVVRDDEDSIPRHLHVDLGELRPASIAS